MEQVQTSTTELWCSGCQCTHPVSAFGVNRSNSRGYQTTCRMAQAKYRHTDKGRAAVAKYKRSPEGRAANAKHYAANREAVLEQKVKHYATNREAKLERVAKYQAELRRKTFEIIGDVCSWSLLGGCAGELEADHLIPVKRRHKVGYTSAGIPLYRWIVQNPAEAKKRLQPLCNCHNCFKNDRSEVDAQAAWVKKNPVLFLMTVASGLEEAGVLDLQRAA